MSRTRDCGDLSVAVVIRTSVKYRGKAVTDEQKLARIRIDEKIAELLPALEKTMLGQVCDHIGYDDETCAANIKERDEKSAANAKAEAEGREEKQRKRDGLPPLQPHPPPVKGLDTPAEGASEQEDNTTD